MRSALRLAALGLLGSWTLAVATAGAAEPRRHGPACTPTGCPGPAPASTATTAAAFAVAAFASGALARRRDPARR